MRQAQPLFQPTLDPASTESDSKVALTRIARLPVQPGRLLIVLAPHAAADEMLALTAWLAAACWQRAAGNVHVLDGGNRFNAYRVAHHLRQLGCPSDVLEHITVQRAFTCYQMTALLEAQVSAEPPLILLVLDLLDTFYDESAPLPERRWLAQRGAAALRRLVHTRAETATEEHPAEGQKARNSKSAAGAVVVSLRPPRPDQQGQTGMPTTELQEIITAAADVLWLAPALSALQELPPGATVSTPVQLPLW